MDLVVSDTSPIRALAHVGYLHLLPELFAEVLIPPAVMQELTAPDSKLPPIPLTMIPFVKVQAPSDDLRLQELSATLDPGEAEALALAVERHAAGILIDEAAGRAAAERLGMPTVGALGILVQGKLRGLLPSVEPLIDRLQNEINFRVSAKLKTEILRLANEIEPRE